MYDIHIMVGGCIPTPLKEIRVKVNWDDDIPNCFRKMKIIFQTTKQASPARRAVNLRPMNSNLQAASSETTWQNSSKVMANHVLAHII